MATAEYPEKHSWWLNELESLGINTREESQLGDPKKTSEMTMDIKQMFYGEYKKAFSEGSV
jgi:CTP-dependent riboflavin kinase